MVGKVDTLGRSGGKEAGGAKKPAPRSQTITGVYSLSPFTITERKHNLTIFKNGFESWSQSIAPLKEGSVKSVALFRRW